MREGWIEITINELISNKGIFCDGDWVESKDQDPNGDIRLIQLADIGEGYFNNKSNRFLTKQKAKKLNCTYLQAGDILLARMPDPLGRATIFPLKEKNKYVTVVDVAIIRPENNLIENKYLTYIINSPFSRKNIELLQSGTTRKRISRKNLSKIQFPLAPLPEQRAIVAKIEQLFSELDNGIINLKSAKEKLKIYRQAVLKKAFEGELTKEWRKKQSDLNTNEKDMSHKYLSEISDVATGATPKKSNSSYWNNGDIPWVTSGASNNSFVIKPSSFITKKALEETNCKIFPVGTLLIAMYGEGKTRGKCSELKIEASTNQAIAAILVKEEFEESKKYLKWFFIKNYNDIRMLSSGGVQPNLNLTKIKETLIPFPCLKEQNQIVQEIGSRLSVCDNILKNIEEGLEKAEALRQSILKKAFEGELLTQAELEACRNEPDWETAEKLLERIKVQQETPSEKKKSSVKKKRKLKKKINPVEYYKRTLLAAEIVSQLHNQPTLGHLKLQKLIYLCQESGDMKLPTNFLQQAAGPYDPQMGRSIDKQLKTKKWFEYKSDELLKYQPLVNAGEHKVDFNKYYSNNIANIQKIIDLFKTVKSDKIEIVATIYACWKQIIEENAIFSESLLIKRFYEWSSEKSKYTKSRIKKEVGWMRKEGVTPVNTRKYKFDEKN